VGCLGLGSAERGACGTCRRCSAERLAARAHHSPSAAATRAAPPLSCAPPPRCAVPRPCGCPVTGPAASPLPLLSHQPGRVQTAEGVSIATQWARAPKGTHQGLWPQAARAELLLLRALSCQIRHPTGRRRGGGGCGGWRAVQWGSGSRLGAQGQARTEAARVSRHGGSEHGQAGYGKSKDVN
jgi:hypothetical protein